MNSSIVILKPNYVFPLRQMWELQIRDVRAADAGQYECQMTSHPPAALFFQLRVVGEWGIFFLFFLLFW